MFVRLRCGGNLPLCLTFGTGVLGVLGVLWWLGGWVVGWLAFGTGDRLLRYGICVPNSKRLPGVRDASSKARRTADSTDCGQPPAHRTHLQCAKQPPLGGEQT